MQRGVSRLLRRARVYGETCAGEERRFLDFSLEVPGIVATRPSFLLFCDQPKVLTGLTWRLPGLSPQTPVQVQNSRIPHHPTLLLPLELLQQSKPAGKPRPVH